MMVVVRIDLDRLRTVLQVVLYFVSLIKRQSNFRKAGRQIEHPVFNAKNPGFDSERFT